MRAYESISGWGPVAMGPLYCSTPSPEAHTPLDATWPTSHIVHSCAPAAANVPTLQMTHLPCSSSGADPAGHVAQLPERSPTAATAVDGHGSHALALLVA